MDSTISTRDRSQPESMRRFFIIWIPQIFSWLGSQSVQFALIWWLTQETGSATVLAVSTLMAVLPQVLIGPFAGVLVDRWNRRLMMMIADGAIALATVALAVLYHQGGPPPPWFSSQHLDASVRSVHPRQLRS